jgi:hypothetical protein
MTKHKFETDRRIIKLILLEENYPPYWDEGMNFHKSKGGFQWKRKQIMSYQYRMYRNWKYNRKTQYKMKKTFDAL